MSLLDRFIKPTLLAKSPEEARRARLAVALSLAAMTVFAVAAVGQLAAHNPAAGVVDIACVALNLASLVLLRRTGRLALATHLLMAVVYVAVALLAVFVRGAGLSGATVVLALIPLFATMIAGTRAGAVWLALSLATGIAVAAVGRAGLIRDHLSSHHRLFNDHLALFVITLMLFAAAVIFEQRKEAALRAIEALEQAKRRAEFEQVRTQAAAQLAAAERFAALGRVAAATAHEINNPLAYVTANLQFIAEAVADRPELRTSIQDALDGARRIARIVRDMSRIARPQDEAIGSVVVADAVGAALKLAEPQTHARARVTTALEEVPPVAANESRLVQVFLNLLVNAAQAIPAGRAAENEIAVAVRASGGRVVVEVRDSGCGIPPDLIERVKEPFFTTKHVGEGTGLGLALSEAIVRSYGGTLTLESAPGRTVARVTLVPAVAPGERKPPLEAAAPATAPPAAALKILVIDDEEMVAKALARILRPNAVTVAHSGREALALLDGGARFDVIFCDLIMPELTGMDLFSRFRALDPALAERMVFMTGGTFTDQAEAFRGSIPNPFIEKPFDPARVRALVKSREHASA